MGARLWRWLAPVLVLALGAGAGAAFLVANAIGPAELPVDRTPVPLAQHRPCAAVQLFLDDDETMRRTAQALAGDPQARRVFVQTKAESYARFRELYQDDPELMAQVRPEDIPGSVTVIPMPHTDLQGYAADLRKRHPEADVQVLDGTAFRQQVRPGEPGPVCPRAGEF
ncbi:hypothetical protein GCM10022222_13340 [Amycolatopsis ultiminotia]|uniref:FtsX extracellular domain-containing protein n=1 Tax=Amycolatopsis ultiminotia TaxID=543629 RepID=A0ABP6VAG7_9PSEU